MEQIKLEEFNHWWITNKVDEDLALQFKRDIYNIIEKRIENRFILALTGLRRVADILPRINSVGFLLQLQMVRRFYHS